MNQETWEEFEKLSKADQKWTLEVLQLLGLLGEEQRQAAIELAGTLADCNAAKAEKGAGA